MKQYKVAIIGNGMICNAAHIPAYKAMGDKVKIVAVADIREEAAKETAERHGIPKYYVDPYKMLEEEKPDIISGGDVQRGGEGGETSVCHPVSAFHG